KKNRKIKIFVKELEGEMLFKPLSLREYLDIADDEYEGKDSMLIFNTCVEPNLRDEVLIKNLGCNSNPYEVVGKILSSGVIFQIANEILEQSELKEKGNKSLIRVVGEEIKN
ncbi:MAG: regulator, partial [Cetobacterium sp.]